MPFFGVPIRNGLPIGLGSVAGFGVQQFDPSQLFEGGTVAGAWYDPSDLSTMFDTSAGTTPVAMPGGGSAVVVGRMLDKSGNGNHAISFNNTTARPELRARVNLLVATATLSTQSVTTQATSYTLSFAGTGSITLSGTATGSYSAGTHTITCTAGTLTLTVSGTVTTADLRPANFGALLPAYQAVVDANTYDTSGFPLYLLFEGAAGQRGMYTPANLNLSSTNKVTVFAGVRKLVDAAAAILTELSAVSATTDGSFSIVASTIDGGADRLSYGFNARGTVTSVVRTARSYAAPITNVVTGQYDNAAATIPTQIVMRVNGATPTTQADPFGPTSAGNFGTHPLFIGARNNSSLWLNGQLYSLAIVGSTVSAGNIAAMESWVAGRTGIQI